MNEQNAPYVARPAEAPEMTARRSSRAITALEVFGVGALGLAVLALWVFGMSVI